MVRPRVYADFNNADVFGRLRLNCIGTVQDLARQKVELHEGLVLDLYADDTDVAGRSDDLNAEGVVAYSQEEKIWVAAIDWSAIRHVSDLNTLGANGASQGNSNSNRNKVET